MTRSQPLVAVAACLVAVTCWSPAVVVVPAAAATAGHQLDLMLVHANDMHSRFDETDERGNECLEDDAARGLCYGGFGRVARFVKDARREAAARGVPSLFVVPGDTFQGTPYYSFFKWSLVVDFVNQLRPDVMTLGNHEFDDGTDSLISYLNGIKSIPTVISNLNTTAKPRLNDYLQSSYIFTLNNTKVGIVGYLTTETKHAPTTDSVEFLDEIESLKKETKILRENGVNIVIALGHSGIERDREIAKEVEDIDLIVGGHSHTFLYSGKPPSIEFPYGPYPMYVKNRKNKTVPILHAYAYTKYMGKVDLKFDSDGELVSINGSPTLLNHKIQQDPEMMVVVNRWKSEVTRKTNFTVGRTAVELMNECYTYECNIGNLIADAFVYYNIWTKQVDGKYWTDAPIGIIHSSAIRTSINVASRNGFITMGQLINVMPFMRTLVKITISGKTLLEAFENSVSDYVMNYGGRHFLQVSGIKVEYDLRQRPGQRVSSLFVRCGRCSVPKFEPLVLNNNYTIVMNDYLAEGGSNYKSFTKIVKKNEIIGVEDYNAVAIYLKAISPVTTGIEGRINFKNTNNEKSKAPSIKISNCQLLFVFLYTFMFFDLHFFI